MGKATDDEENESRGFEDVALNLQQFEESPERREYVCAIPSA